MKKKTAILIGAGMRGKIYTDYALDHPEQLEIVAVAEPEQDRRNYIKDKHHLSEEYVFDDYPGLLELGKIADVAIICTMDRDHYEPVMKAMELGYDCLLEKPVSVNAQECQAIADKAIECNVKVVVCHVLRYTPFYMTLKKCITDGMVGRIMSIEANEQVGNLHQSHSFVRGNWGNSERSSFMLLQKCCHDMDILQWLVDKPCKRVSSFGGLTYFTTANKPQGAPARCIEGCSAPCYYNAVKLYLEDEKNSWFRCAATKKNQPTNEDVKLALETGPYGKCVFDTDNDVVDHQVVNVEYIDGTTLSFSMNAFNKGGRAIEIFGTDGTLSGFMEDSRIEYFDFKTRLTTRIDLIDEYAELSGHGGGDEGIMKDFIAYLNDEYQGNNMATIDISVKNHLIVFAAEKSRLEGKVIEMKDFIKTQEAI